jgi:hypothetical protein
MRILTHRLPPASAGAIPLTVAELIKIVRADKAAATEEKVLAALGLAFRDNSLLVFIEHNAMLDLFRAEPYNGKGERIKDELRQIDPAVKVSRRWLEVRMYAVVIPESALDKYLTEPTNPF